MSLSDLQKRLLDCLFCQQPLPSHLLDTLTLQDWQRLSLMLAHHRLAPLLHWRLNNELKHLIVADHFRPKLQQRFQASSLRTLALQRELVQLHHRLNAAGIAYAALKGAYLAFHVYPNPALRPLRDLDILVSSDDLLTSYNVLLKAGYQGREYSHSYLEKIKQGSLHLPPLMSPDGKVYIELHHHIIGANTAQQQRATLTNRMWSRRIRVTTAGASVSFLATTDLLLHLIEHAVYHHRFDNGALLVSDIAFLIQRESIDWSLFWAIAAEQQWLKGCVLVLKMVQYYYPDLSIKWNKHGMTVPTEMILNAHFLSLADPAQSNRAKVHDQYRVRHQATHRQPRAHLFWKTLFCPPHQIASHYGLKGHSSKIYLYYALHFLRLFFSKMPAILKSIFSKETQSVVKQLKKVNSWLD